MPADDPARKMPGLDNLLEAVVAISSRPRLLVAATAGVLLSCGIAYAVIEHHDLAEGLWWACVTGFTVGYGDSYPATNAGRVIGAILMVSMFVLAVCLSAQLTSRLVADQDRFTHAEQEQMKLSLARLEELVSSLPACRCAAASDVVVPAPAGLAENDRREDQ